MNELQAYVDSLPSMLSEEEKKKLVKQWKIDNKWGGSVSEVSQQAWEGKSTKIAKIDPVVETDAPATGENKSVSKSRSTSRFYGVSIGRWFIGINYRGLSKTS